jgi:hypothetical protein
MSALRRAFPFLLALALSGPAHAGTTSTPAPLKAPTGLHAFLLRADEPAADSFPRTPSFAWDAVAGAYRYDFELSTSATFAPEDLAWSGVVNGTPTLSLPVALPWAMGTPYALYARIRTVTRTAKSPWSKPYGFNMSAPDAPSETLGSPGLIRWSPVEGATSYQVWWTDLGKQISTITTSADQREFYTFHQLAPWPDVVHWQVRAVRAVYKEFPNGLASVSYGSWSPVFTSHNPPFSVGPLTLANTVSETADEDTEARLHSHVPAFLFGGSETLDAESELYRVYVFDDSDCTNVVFRGAVVGGPAYSPRTSGPLALPTTADALASARLAYLTDGDEGTTVDADLKPVASSESVKEASPTPPATPGFALPTPEGALIDLADSGWPDRRYYWTVVPVEVVVAPEGSVTYRETELPKDACAAGRVDSFGTESAPTTTGNRATPTFPGETPFASGVATSGKLVSATSAKPTFYGSPVVAWRPSFGALAYEVQRSRSLSPWSSEGKPVFTFGTSTVLQNPNGTRLPAGTWYYRVRGLNPYVSGTDKHMSWSKPTAVVLAKPKFAVLGWTVAGR